MSTARVPPRFLQGETTELWLFLSAAVHWKQLTQELKPIFQVNHFIPSSEVGNIQLALVRTKHASMGDAVTQNWSIYLTFCHKTTNKQQLLGWVIWPGNLTNFRLFSNKMRFLCLLPFACGVLWCSHALPRWWWWWQWVAGGDFCLAAVGRVRSAAPVQSGWNAPVRTERNTVNMFGRWKGVILSASLAFWSWLFCKNTLEKLQTIICTLKKAFLVFST